MEQLLEETSRLHLLLSECSWEGPSCPWASVSSCVMFFEMLEKTLECPLDFKEIKPVAPKGNQPWIFIGRTDAEAEAPILWPLDAKNQLFGKDPHAGKDWGQEEKGWQRMRWLDGITDLMGMSFSLTGRWWWTGQLGVLQSMGSQRVGYNWVTEQGQRRISWATLLVLRDPYLGSSWKLREQPQEVLAFMLCLDKFFLLPASHIAPLHSFLSNRAP